MKGVKIMKLIRRYIVSVFEDFSIQTEELMPIDNKVEELSLDSIVKSSGSLRIKQILYVVACIKNNANEQQTIEDKVSSSIKETAIAFKVTSSSVVDKVTRQMGGLNMKEFCHIMKDYVSNGDDKLREQLLSNIGKYTQDDDKLLINSVLI